MADPSLIERMRASAKIAVDAFTMIAPHVKVGVSTNTLNTLCHDFIVQHGAVPAPLGYKGFPKSICTSPNAVICHGIPNDLPLQEGDILNIDISLSKDGAFADTCKMFFLGKPSIMAKRIVKAAQEATYAGIAQVRPGQSLRAIGRAIEYCARQYKYSVVRDFCGHGVGERLHQEPTVLHYDDPSMDHYILTPGMTFTIEPMINVGSYQTRILKDGWTVMTRDRSLSAQYEHTLLVTETGVDILTLRPEEDLKTIFSQG
jgi:methionyl aminopeptidase